MTKEKMEKAGKIQNEIEKYERAINVFDINKHMFSINSDKVKAIENSKKPFGFILRCFKNENKNKVQLSPKGFFGGDSIEVDSEFVEMCLEYFKNKKAECEKRFQEL